MKSCRSVSRCRTRSRGSGSIYLSEELIFKILSWTCVPTLFRCRSVCKLWQSIISKHEFMEAQYNNSHNKIPTTLMITSRIDNDYGRREATIVYPNSPEEDSVYLPLISPFDDVDFVSSCNGIVCVSNADRVYKCDIHLFNPLTMMFKKLPPSISFVANIQRELFSVNVVFGFDCVSNDYKVLKIAYQRTNSKLVNVVAVHLYSSNSDSWKEIEVGIALPSLLCYPPCPVLRSGPVVDGVLYLEAVNTIVTFDLHNETFGLVPYPSFMHTRKSSVLEFEGSVAVVLESVRDGSLDEKEVSLWTVEAVSDEVFWNKMFTFDAGSEEIDWVLMYSGADKFVGQTRLGTVLYEYRKKETEHIGLPSQSFLVRVLKHTESFLSLEGFEGVEDR